VIEYYGVQYGREEEVKDENSSCHVVNNSPYFRGKVGHTQTGVDLQ